MLFLPCKIIIIAYEIKSKKVHGEIVLSYQDILKKAYSYYSGFRNLDNFTKPSGVKQ